MNQGIVASILLFAARSRFQENRRPVGLKLGVRPSSNRQLGRRRHRIYRPIGRELRWRSVVACALSRMANSQRVPRCSYETALETFVLQMSYPASRLQTRVPAIHGANPIAFLRERNSFYSPHAYEHMPGPSTSNP